MIDCVISFTTFSGPSRSIVSSYVDFMIGFDFGFDFDRYQYYRQSIVDFNIE
jgi:hypothetical protein